MCVAQGKILLRTPYSISKPLLNSTVILDLLGQYKYKVLRTDNQVALPLSMVHLQLVAANYWQFTFHRQS